MHDSSCIEATSVIQCNMYRSCRPSIYLLTAKPMAHRKPRCFLFDLSGTLVDPYVTAPVVTLKEVFGVFGIHLSKTQARASMCHPGPTCPSGILHILHHPAVSHVWLDRYKRQPTFDDAQVIFRKYEQKHIQLLETQPEFTRLIPDTLETLNLLRKSYSGTIAITSGYPRKMMDPILHSIRRQGLQIDSSVASDEIYPKSMFPGKLSTSLQRLSQHPDDVLVISGSPADINEGNRFGCVTVGMATHNGRLGDMMALDKITPTITKHADYFSGLRRAVKELEYAGADYIIDQTIESLQDIVDHINLKRCQS